MPDYAKSLPLSRVNNARFSVAVKALLADFAAHVAPDLHTDLHAVLLSLGVLDAALDQALARERVQAITVLKAEADEARDDLVIFGSQFIEAHLRAPRQEPREAASRLRALFDRRPSSFQRLGLDENTHELDQLLADLESPQAVTDLALLGLTEWRAELAAAATALKALVTEDRVLDAQDDGPTLRPTKRAIVSRFGVVFAIGAFHAEQGTAPFPELMTRATQTVAHLKRYRALPPGEEPPTPETPAA